jgi:signal transduction histidine kinase/CheY-like chemotaxis protein
MNEAELARIGVRNDQDVFAMRRMGREVAAAIGMSEPDQIRVATALSEVGREIVVDGDAAAEAAFLVEGGDLVVSLSLPSGADCRSTEGVLMARRLMDQVDADSPDQVIMRKRLPPRAPSLPMGEIRARIDALTPVNALDELCQQNRELAATLEDVRRLNTELEETNQGVMALYNELSAELEETNSGVVALHAELDEKSLQLRQSADARNRFWATISHELRTPLNSIIGLVRLLTGPGSQPLSTEQAHQMELIGSSAQTLLATVGELLDMAKAESGRLDPQLATVDVAMLVEGLSLIMRPTAEAERVRLAVKVPQALSTMVADKAMLTRILRNLLANSLKFTEDGEVVLEVSHDTAADEMVFTVTDTGIGIPAEHLDRVFEEFYQVPGPAQLRARGTGLGLPYARRLSEAMGGTLTLTSTQDQGTTATLRLPHLFDAPVVNRILMAYHDEDFRAGLRRMLTGFATHIDEAPDGEMALLAMNAVPPDLALLDLLMPGLDGTALMRRMAADERLRDVPVIIITAAAAHRHPDHVGVLLGKHGLRRDLLLSAVRQALGTQPA